MFWRKLARRRRIDNKFLSRELHRSEQRMKWILRLLTDEQLKQIGVTAMDRDSEDWAHRAIEQIDTLAVNAEIAHERLSGTSMKTIRRLWQRTRK